MSWDVWLVTKLDDHEITVWEGPNYTHNTNIMIREAGLVEWPYEVDDWVAEKLAHQLDFALNNLEADPKKYRAMNPSNGWGDYDSLLLVLREVREQCCKYPSARVRMSA